MQENKFTGNKLGGRLREFWKKGFQRDNLIVMVLVGILLFVVTIPVKKTGQQTLDVLEAGGEETGRMGGKFETDGAAGTAEGLGGITYGNDQAGNFEDDYEKLQEQKLKNLLSAMDGVGEVEVMLTFVSSKEQVVEKDEPVTRGNTVEKDSEGGSRTVTQYEKGDSTVYGAQGGTPFVTKTLYPRVDGVLVVAEGAGDGTVDRSITEAVQALFGVEAHRVKVLPMGKDASAGR